jgi:Holliday junction resolvase RusA-like endonuclease
MMAGVPLLTVELPGLATGKGRPRFDGRNGRAYTPQKTVSAEAKISYALAQAWTQPPLDEPLALTILVSVPVPSSKSRRWKEAALAGDVLPMGRPDLDNILKLIADAGNKIVWCDDARITEVMIRRRYSEQPGLLIEVCRG